MEQQLAEAKRKGLVSTGVLDKPKKGSAAGKAEVRSDFTKSSQFFKKVNENVAEAGTAGGKRKRGAAGAGSEDGARTPSARYKL